MLTDHELRVRAIRRRSRMEDINYQFFVSAPCKWTKRGRAKHAQYWRIWPRVRDECAEAAGIGPLWTVLGVPYEHCAKAHVDGCQCRRYPQTPRRRKSKLSRRCWSLPVVITKEPA